MTEIDLSPLQTELEAVEPNAQPLSSTSPFFDKIPHELRDQVYLDVLNHNCGVGSAGIFRTNRQMHSEAIDVMLRSQTFILLVIKGSKAVVQSLKSKEYRTGSSVQSFKGYSMRISIVDPEVANVPTTAFMVAGTAAFGDFLLRVMLDDGKGQYSSRGWRAVPSYRRLSWVVDLKAPDKQPKEISRASEHKLVRQLAAMLWEYRAFAFVNPIDSPHTEKALVKITSRKWKSGMDFVRAIQALCTKGELAATQTTDHNSMYWDYLQATHIITSTLRSPQGKEFEQIQDTTYRTEVHRLTYEANSCLAHLYAISTLKLKRHDDAKLAVRFAERSMESLKGHADTNRATVRTAYGQTYYHLAIGYRCLGRLPDANEAIGHALDISSEKSEYQQEAEEIAKAMKKAGIRVSPRLYLS